MVRPVVALLVTVLFAISDARDTEAAQQSAWPVSDAGKPVDAATTAAPDVLDAGGVEILDDYLATRIERLEQRSARFRQAMAAARAGRIPVLIGTTVQVTARLAPRIAISDELPYGHLGEFLVGRVAGSTEIYFIAIRVPIAEIEKIPWRRGVFGGSARRWVDETVDAVLIHEIWGHMVPVLEAGDYSGKCEDPKRFQSVNQSCAMQRENALRRELGLPPRTHYSIIIP